MSMWYPSTAVYHGTVPLESLPSLIYRHNPQRRRWGCVRTNVYSHLRASEPGAMSDEVLTWVASKEVDGMWHQARVVASADAEGQVTLETLDTKEEHRVPSDVSALQIVAHRRARARNARGVLRYPTSLRYSLPSAEAIACQRAPA